MTLLTFEEVLGSCKNQASAVAPIILYLGHNIGELSPVHLPGRCLLSGNALHLYHTESLVYLLVIICQLALHGFLDLRSRDLSAAMSPDSVLWATIKQQEQAFRKATSVPLSRTSPSLAATVESKTSPSKNAMNGSSRQNKHLLLLGGCFEIQMHEVLPQLTSSGALTLASTSGWATHLWRSLGGRVPDNVLAKEQDSALRMQSGRACTRPMPEKILRGASEPIIVAPRAWMVPGLGNLEPLAGTKLSIPKGMTHSRC